MTLRVVVRLFLVCVVVAQCWQDVKCEDNMGSDLQDNGEGRTFGHHFLKRLSFAMIPIMYKLGMMTTLIITLTIMSTKGLGVGVLLLILAISQMISRTYVAPAPAPVPYIQQHQPAVYPLVYSHPPVSRAVEVPVVHQPVVHHKAVVHAAPAYQAYQPYGGWSDRSAVAATGSYGSSPYAREETEETRYDDEKRS